MCKEGKIPAVQEGKRWLIPEGTDKPADMRRRVCQPQMPRRLPIGISDFRKAVSGYYYVDKTLMIRDFLDMRHQVSLFTRPRRFGKTLNMDMLRVFFEISEEDTSQYFRDKKIWACGSEYQKYQGKYPVIFLTFKDVKYQDWEKTLRKLKALIQGEFLRHIELEDSELLTDFEKNYFRNILDDRLNDVGWTDSLAMLSQMLHKHFRMAPVMIVDEYDVPLQQGHTYGFYDDVILFLRNFFSAGVKDNPHLSFAFLTGILRVAKESIFSGMNNLKVFSVLEERYSEYFGFTRAEMEQMLVHFGMPERMDEICRWYDGYRFGRTEIFNPWSVINYIDESGVPKAYWQSTGSNDIIEEIMQGATPDVLEQLQLLMRGEAVVSYVDTGVIYPEIRNNPSSVFSFLLVAGYLKIKSSDALEDGNYMCELQIPNREIMGVYNREILNRYSNILPQTSSIAIQQALYLRNEKMLQMQLRELLLRTVSYLDAANEAFYHGLILGLCALMRDSYELTSNREAGEGRYDICLRPLKKGLPGILIELKSEKDCTEKQLEILAKKAVAQIEERRYEAGLADSGCRKVFSYGIAFSGKQVKVSMKENLYDE